jgi:hypothetical protein
METIVASCTAKDINGNNIVTRIYIPIIHVLTFTASVSDHISVIFDPIWVEKMANKGFVNISTNATLSNIRILNQ